MCGHALRWLKRVSPAGQWRGKVEYGPRRAAWLPLRAQECPDAFRRMQGPEVCSEQGADSGSTNPGPGGTPTPANQSPAPPRLLAARKCGLGVACRWLCSTTQRDAEAWYILADNRISENAGWDEDTLAAELGELQAGRLAARVCWASEEELAKLLADTEPAAEASCRG